MRDKIKKSARRSQFIKSRQRIVLCFFFVFIFCFSLVFKTFAATGDVTAIRIVGATTDVADVTSACNTSSSCTGWVAEVDVSDVSAGGTYSLGMGTNNNPASAKLACTVTSQGYDTNGSATTISRTVYGTHQLRKIYNAGYTAPYPNDETLVSSTLTLRIALSDFVYSPDTNVTCNVGAGIYNDGTHSSSASTGLVATNGSTLAYPRVIANWAWPGWTRINSSLAGDGTNNSDGSFTVRAVGFQRHAMNSKPLAAMVFTATDQHSHTVSTTVNDMTIDSSIADASKVQEYKGTFSTAQVNTLTQGDLVTVQFKAYPWVGDSGAVMDTSDGVNSQPTPLYAPIYFINDRLGTYGTAAAVVDPVGGNDSTCVAVAESAFIQSSPPAACLTINKAASVIRTLNNTNGRGDAAGTIYLQAGNYNWSGSSNTITGTANAWTVIKPFPGVAKADVVVNAQSGNKDIGASTKVKFDGITVNVATGPSSIWTGFSYLWFNNSSMISNGTAPIYQINSWYITDSTVGAFTSALRPFDLTNHNPVLVRGNNITGYTNGITTFTVLGNVNTNAQTANGFQDSDVSTPKTLQPIIAYNKFLNSTITSSNPLTMFATLSSIYGAAIIQNLFEYNGGTSVALNMVAPDGSTSTPVNNVMLWHNTLVGQRINRCYNDNGSTLRLRTLWSEVGQLYDWSAIKSDTFVTASAGRLGNWACEYGVGWHGNADGTVLSTQFQPEFPGLYSNYPAVGASKDAQANNEPPMGVSTNPATWQGYVDRQSWNGSTAGSGNGNYHLTTGSPAIGLIPSGQAVLPYDIDGVARKNNGAGAAGAYEFLTGAKAITAFNFTSPLASGTITEGSHTIALTVPFGTDIAALIPTITQTGVSISPASGAAQNFTSPVTYTVTAEDGTTQAYTVTVTVAPNTSTNITSFNFADPSVTGTVDNVAHTVGLTVPFGTTVTNLTPTIALATGATISPISGSAQSFSSPVTYTVTAQDGTTHQDYVVTVTIEAATVHTITASAGSNGSISPNGDVHVNDGDSQSFAITPDPGYHVLDVLVDGSSIGAVTGHDFTGVVADHTISATFELDGNTDNNTDNNADNQKDLNVHSIKAESTQNTVTITWKTDYNSKSTIKYGRSKNLKRKKKDDDKEKKHEVVLENLFPGTKYYFRLKATDGNGNEDSSSIHSVMTKPAPAAGATSRVPIRISDRNTNTNTNQPSQNTQDSSSSENSSQQIQDQTQQQPQQQPQQQIQQEAKAFHWWNPTTWF